jgi:hypothetical protein
MAEESIEISAKNLEAIAAAAKKGELNIKGVTKAAQDLIAKVRTAQIPSILQQLGAPVPNMIKPAYVRSGGLPPQLIPPIIQQSILSRNINWKMAGLGAMSAPFSPWISARALSGSGLMGHGGGGGGGGMMTAIAGQGGMGGFLAAYAAIQVTMKGLELAFRNLKAAVESGAHFWQQAAKLGRPAGQLAGLETAFGAFGINPQAIERLMVNTQIGRRRGGVMGDFQGEMLRGAASSGDLELMQAIKNAGPQLNELIARLTSFSMVVQETSGAMQSLRGTMTVLKADWQAIWMEIMTAMRPLIELLSSAAISQLELMAQYISALNNEFADLAGFVAALGKLFADLIAYGPVLLGARIGSGLEKKEMQDIAKAVREAILPPGPGDSRMGAGTGHIPVTSQWQRLGFNLPGWAGGGTNYPKQIADNTKKIADVITGKSKGGNPDWMVPSLQLNGP